MTTFSYPSAAEMREIEREKLPVLLQADPVFEILPITEVDDDLLIWEQRDNYVGLQKIRGLNGQPSRIAVTGAKQYMMRPGYYGEFIRIDEEKLTRRRQYGTFGSSIKIDDLVMDAQDQLLNRRVDLVRYIAWTLLTSGTFSIANPVGGKPLHTDTFPLQTYDGSDWGVAGTATPLADFRAVGLLARGKGCSFGSQARAFMNLVTFNKMTANTNSADLGGKRTNGLATVQGLAAINAVLLQEGLPQIVINDDGYLNDAGTFVPYIANDTVTVVGRRTSGVRLGEYRMTRNANNPNLAPGAYTKVVDRGEVEVPRQIDVHDGHNGGPVIEFPGSIVRMAVGA